MNGLPSFSMEFIELAATAIVRSARGVVGVILKDDTDQSFTTKTYYSAVDVKDTEWDATNFKYLKELAFRGNPFKVVVYRLAAAATDLAPATVHFGLIEPNYVCMPGASTQNVTDLVSWVNSIRNSQQVRPSTIKLIVAGSDADKEYIIDIEESQTFTVDGTTHTAQEYSICIAGMAGGVSLNSSLTYYKMPWIESCVLVADEDTAVKAGKLVTTYDGANYKIVRGVTSFITPTDSKNRSFSKIRLMEIMDLHMKDIRNTYDKYYLGKYQNIYSNKMLFAGAVNAYLSTFVQSGQLDPANANRMDVDLEAHRLYLIEKGEDEEYVNGLSEYQMRRINTGDKLLMEIADYKPTDVMEDSAIKAYL